MAENETRDTPETTRLIEAAKAGDESAFARLAESSRGELHAHCYRMLGSVHDAEDALQDAMLRAWRSLDRFEGRSAFKSWLYRIATNVSLDLLQKRKKRHLATGHGPPGEADGGPGAPLVESVWIEPYPSDEIGLDDGLATPEARYEQRESVELAFVASLQHLPATQRAVLILREVLGFSAKEVAETMDTTVASVTSTLQRARATIVKNLPDQSQQQTLKALGDEEIRVMVESYMEAWEKGDVDLVASMLAEEAVISMPPMANWFQGEELFVFLRKWAFSGRVYNLEDRRVKCLPTIASGQLAFATYRWDLEQEVFLPAVLQVLTLDGSKISEITGFVMPDAFAGFGLPESLPE
ncbi:MAG: sigma-70 family RNA polymerase sigma factor [Solirubrobacterales bacterium]